MAMAMVTIVNMMKVMIILTILAILAIAIAMMGTANQQIRNIYTGKSMAVID